MSKLDPKVYGPPESKITKELIDKEIGGYMTTEEVQIHHFYFIYFDQHKFLMKSYTTHYNLFNVYNFFK